jgi:hypothetical protein
MKVRKTVGAVATSLGLVVGFAALAGAAPESSITYTGPDSYNKVKNKVSTYVKVKNDNDLRVNNDNDQTAWTGDATVRHNTTGGDAETGDAKNTNSLSVSATVNNAASGGDWRDLGGHGGGNNAESTIHHTGPDSYNKVDNETKTTVRISNDNDLRVNNDNDQTAISGDARVSGNTTGGDAETGDATNHNSTTVNFNVSN